MENALVIFVRNTEKGKVKKKLAKALGEEEALAVYKYLLEHTKNVAISCKYNLFVFYSEYIHISDLFDDGIFSKHLQEGNDLGERMLNAFKKVSHLGMKKICLIGSDFYRLESEILDQAFEHLDQKDVVLGPSSDGNYYLVGTKTLLPDLFTNKSWGTSTVLDDTLDTLDKLQLTSALLPQLNDVDEMDDLLKTDILTRLKEG